MEETNIMTTKVGRNDPCQCGDGKKYKKINNNARSDVLARLTPPEAGTVLRILLKRYKNLRPEAERIATELMAAPSLNDIAENVSKEKPD